MLTTLQEIKVITHSFNEQKFFNQEVNKALKDGFELEDNRITIDTGSQRFVAVMKKSA